MKLNRIKRLLTKVISFLPLLLVLFELIIMALNETYNVSTLNLIDVVNKYCLGFDSFLNISAFKNWLVSNAFVNLPSDSLLLINIAISLFAWYTCVNLVSLFFDFINYIIDFARSFLNRFYE